MTPHTDNAIRDGLRILMVGAFRKPFLTTYGQKKKLLIPFYLPVKQILSRNLLKK